MKKQIEFFFDVGSPASYLAWTQLHALAERQGAEVVYQPMLLGAIFKTTGNSSPASVPAKGRYCQVDFARFAKRYDVPFVFNPFFPINTMPLMRAAVAYLGTEQYLPYIKAVFQAIWAEGKDMGNPEVIAQVLGAAGLNVGELMQKIEESAVKDRLREITEEALARDVFGAPTMFVGGQMFFGQDRLDFVEEALAQ